MSLDLVATGHVGDWPELAVEYVDGHLDDATKAAIQQHLDNCPDCAATLAAQQTAVSLFADTGQVDPPPTLETQVLEQVLPTIAVAKSGSAFARRRFARARRERARSLPAGPWIPALAGAAAVVALVLALTISQSPAPLDETASGDAALVSAESATAATRADGSVIEPTTTSAREQMAVNVTASTDSPEDTGSDGTPVSLASLQPVGPYVEDEEVMVTELVQADTPAYVFFDTLDGTPVTSEQADTLTTRFSSLTGLQLMDEAVSSGIRSFAAYVPRENASAVVDLLFALGDSMDLSVCMSLDPGSQVESWAGSMLEDSASLPELSAAPRTPTGWRYTTSTAPPTTEGATVTTKTTLPKDSGERVLMVIFMTVQE